MPAPPPPPPMAPAAPPPPVFKPPKGSNDRDALLKSIQKGKKLKKTITNDKSAPLIPGASKTSRSINNNESVHSNVISPIKNLSSIQMELKKQLANDNRNRGPPPPAPNRNISSEANGFRINFLKQEKAPNGLNLSQLSLKSVNLNANKPTGLQVNPSSLHRKAKSNANLSTLEISEDTNDSAPARPSFNSGKPNLAPKPPVLNGKPNLSNRKLSKPVSRAHSLRSPRSPSPESQDSNPKFGTVRHMSSIIGPSLANSSTHIARSRPALNSRPTAPPPSIPSSPGQHPAPPPPSKLTAPVKHPNHAPPPPPPSVQIPQAPSHAPPPPPHKTLPPFKPPQPALPIANSNPPPPPPRHSSIREAHGKPAVDLGEKFKDMFRSPDTFPNPPPFRNVIKLYSSKQSQSLKSGFIV